MDKSLKSKIQLLAAAGLANGDLYEVELEYIANIAEELEIESEQLVNEIKKAADEIRKIEDPELFDKFIYDVAKEIDEEERLYFYEILLGLITCDNVLDIDEVSVAALMAKALKLENYEIIVSVATLVNANKELEIPVDL